MAPASVVSSTPMLTHPHTLADRRVYGLSRRDSKTAQLPRVPPTISKVVSELRLRGDKELDSDISARLLSYTYDSIRDWIGTQRISHLPPEGSSYDKVLAWAHLFVERLHSFDMAIGELAGEGNPASQLAYGYCAILLELGKENASGLMILFGFFYVSSMPLANLLERTELFGVSHEILEQMYLALSDLVTLIASVATHFHQAIHDMSTQSVSISIYSTFSAQIKSFHERCEGIAQSMWRHQVLAGDIEPQAVSDIKPIQSWLAPSDPVLTDAAVSVSLLAYDREERTCLWVGSHLTRFLRGQNKILSINGRPGCGKSIASSVIIDYLQRPILGVRYNALFIPISSTISAELSASAVAKAILSQLFEKSIGNIPLLQKMRDAKQHSQHATTHEEYDNILWGAVESALAAAQRGVRELIIVVDGVDEASCGQGALSKRLTRAAEQGNNVRLIMLGNESQPGGAGRTSIQVDEDLVFDDIMAVVRSSLDSNRLFSKISEFEKESTSTRVTEASACSFLRAKLVTKRLRRETDVKKFLRAVDTVVKSKPTVTSLVLQDIQASNITKDVKHMLAWLAIAERPLSPRELETLASIQVDKGTISDKRIDVMAALAPLQDLVSLHDGLVYVRHGLIRSSLRELLPQLLPANQDSHADLTARLLLYVKRVVKEDHEPSAAQLDGHETNRLLNKYPLLHFAARYWPVHLTKTDVFAREGSAGAAKAFAHVYPISVTAMLLQASLWEHLPKPVLLKYQTILTNIHRELFKGNSVLTLQSVIFLAILHQQVNMTNEAAALFSEATTMCNDLLGPTHTVTLQMASSYLQITKTKVTSTRTDVMNKREQALLIVFECYKAQFGSASAQVVTILRQIVEHHRSLGENKKAERTIEIIGSITDQKWDESGDHDLRVQLRRRSAYTAETGGATLRLDVEERDERLEGRETRGFILVLREAEKAAVKGHYQQAEGLYLDLMQRLSREHRVHDADVWAETDLQALLSYSKFLLTRKRSTEASAILVGIWADYNKSASSLTTESSAALLTQVGHMMRSVGLSSVALSVFKHCAEFYRTTSRTQTSTYEGLQQSIQVTSQEVQASSDTVTSETTLEEIVVESSSSISTASPTTFAAVGRLVSVYVSQHRWHDATRFIKKILRGVWPSLFSVSIEDVTLVDGHVEICVQLAGRLAECYRLRRRIAKEGDIRVRVYRALRSGRPVGDDLRQRATGELLAFYQRTSQHEPGIVVREEMLDDFTEHYGEGHPVVVKALWELAELTRPRPIFVEYYKRIIRILTNNSEVVSAPEALEPVIIVASELWGRGLLSDALPYYAMLFNTFLTAPNTSPKFRDEAWVGECFVRYSGCLRSVHSSFAVLHRITTEYQAQCKHVYGATASLTIQATLALATLCQGSKSCELQAIALYDELLQLKSDKIDRHEISACLEMLHEMQTVDTMALLDSAEASTSQINTAMTVLRKRITSVRETHGWAHEESLSRLTELVHVYSKHGQVETATQELREVTVKVVATEKSSTRLIAAASTIVASYVAINQVHKVTELAEDIYRQVVMKDTTGAEQSTSTNLSVCGRESLIFLAQMEQSLRRNSATLIEILAALTTQYVYFSEFRASIARESSSSFIEVLAVSARLYHDLTLRGRHGAAEYTFERFSGWFSKTEGERLKLSAALPAGRARLFLRSLLDYFGTHESRDVVRSVGIMGNAQVREMLTDGRFQDACDLGLACFHYIAAHKDAYHTTTMGKLVLTMGMAVAGREPRSPAAAKPSAATRKKLLETSRTILHDVLDVLLNKLKINLAQLDLARLNQLVSLVGDQEDWTTLAALLTSLWNSHEAQHDWHPSVTFTLARRYILAQWVVGDFATAIRMAEHMVYNCRRVHGPRHPSTLGMSVLLGQLYTGSAQRYQQGWQKQQQQQQHHQQQKQQHQKQQQHGRKGSIGSGDRTDMRDMAKRYYKKAAALYENILRLLTDPVYASMDGGPLMDDDNLSDLGSTGGTAEEDARRNSGPGSTLQAHMSKYGGSSFSGQQQQHQQQQDIAQQIRQFLHLLKLAVQRLGGWPKEYAEYERLGSDVFREYGADLQDVDGVDKWELKAFGQGRAEADDDLLRPGDLRDWALLEGEGYGGGGGGGGGGGSGLQLVMPRRWSGGSGMERR